MRTRLHAAVTVAAVLVLLAQPSHSLGGAATLSVAAATSTVCGLLSGDDPHSIRCARPFTQNPSPFAVFPNISFLSLSGGGSSFCALRPDSTSFLCWDSATLSPKRVYPGPDPLSGLSVGSSQIAAVAADGVRFWRGGRAFPVSAPGAFHFLTSGNGFTCAINNDGRVQCWGGRPGDGIQRAFRNQSMSTLVAGGSHACGLSAAGRLICVGSNSSGQLGNSSGPAAAFEYAGLALGGEHTCAIKRANRTVVCWGGDGLGGEYSPIGNTSVEALVAGGSVTCGVTTVNFSVVCWLADRRNLSVTMLALPKILPGICVKKEDQESSCGCGIVPGSESLCSGSGVICSNVCVNSPPTPVDTPSPEPAPSPPQSSSKKTSKWWWVFAIIGGVGTLIGVCSIIYCIWNCVCRQKKVYNSVQPTISATTAAAGPNPAGGGNSSGAVPSPRVSPNGSKSRIFRRQGSRAVMRRQRSGPSSFKERAEQFSFSDLAAATKNFAPENKIGAGSFGTVYRGKLADGREVAIKRSENNARTKKLQEKESAFQSELSFLSRLHHKHLVGLVGYCDEREERLLVYEYMKNGALYDHLHGGTGNSEVLNSWRMRIRVLLDAARGIEYLHNYAVPPIIHRDIKSSNILLDANWVARVSDLGLSLMGPETGGEALLERAVGTVGYMDPEYYGLHHLTVKSDVYGLGVVMLEVLTGKRAIFRGDDGRGSPVSVVDFAMPSIVQGELGKVLDPRVGPPGASEAEAVELVAYTAVHCVSLEGKERPSIADIVSNLESALALCEQSHGSISSASISLGSYD